MTSPKDDSSTSVTADGASLSCVRCGYDLRGLDQSGNCPECGAAIEESMHGDLLRYADPEWLCTVLRGVACLHAGALALLWAVFGIILFSAAIALIRLGGASDSWHDSLFLITRIAAIVAGMTGIVLVALGLWWITESEPREGAGVHPMRARRIARWSLLLLALALGYFAAVASVPMLVGSVFARESRYIAVALALVLVLLSVLALMIGLVRRMDDPALLRIGQSHMKTFRWLLPVVEIGLTVVYPLQYATTAGAGGIARPTGPLSMLLSAGGCLTSFLLIAAAVDGIRAVLWGGKVRRAIKSHLESQGES